MIGLDSSAIIDFFKGDEKLSILLRNIKDSLVANQIVYLELMFGIDSNNLVHLEEEKFYDAFFDSLIVFDLDRNAGKLSSRIFHELSKKGEKIGEFDCIIAGIYLSKGVDKIITKNAKHFEKVKGLKVLSY